MPGVMRCAHHVQAMIRSRCVELFIIENNGFHGLALALLPSRHPVRVNQFYAQSRVITQWKKKIY